MKEVGGRSVNCLQVRGGAGGKGDRRIVNLTSNMRVHENEYSKVQYTTGTNNATYVKILAEVAIKKTEGNFLGKLLCSLHINRRHSKKYFLKS